MLPDLDSLRCFIAAAELLNFRAAARRVALSPAAFSDRMQRLEETVGALLFERTSRRVTLTAAGERLLAPAQQCLDAARTCLTAVDAERVLPFGLRMGTRFELGLSWLVPALGALQEARPERTLHLYFADTADQLHRLQSGDVDAIVSSARLALAGLDAVVLHEEAYALVATPRRMAEHPFAEPGDAGQQVLLDVHPDLPLFRYFLDARPAAEVWGFGRVEHLGTIGAIRHRLLEHAGLAVLPRYFINGDLQAGVLVEPLPAAKLLTDHFRLIWRRGHALTAELRGLAEELRARPLA